MASGKDFTICVRAPDSPYRAAVAGSAALGNTSPSTLLLTIRFRSADGQPLRDSGQPQIGALRCAASVRGACGGGGCLRLAPACASTLHPLLPSYAQASRLGWWRTRRAARRASRAPAAARLRCWLRTAALPNQPTTLVGGRVLAHVSAAIAGTPQPAAGRATEWVTMHCPARPPAPCRRPASCVPGPGGRPAAGHLGAPAQ